MMRRVVSAAVVITVLGIAGPRPHAQAPDTPNSFAQPQGWQRTTRPGGESWTYTFTVADAPGSSAAAIPAMIQQAGGGGSAPLPNSMAPSIATVQGGQSRGGNSTPRAMSLRNSVSPASAGAGVDIAATRAYLRTSNYHYTPEDPQEVPTPAVGQGVYFHIDFVLSGNASPLEISHRAVIDGVTHCSFSPTLTANPYVSWCDNVWIATTGTHTLQWDLDYTNTVAETDESNNSASKTFTSSRDIAATRTFLRWSNYHYAPFDSKEVPTPVVGQGVFFHVTLQISGPIAVPVQVTHRAVLDGAPFCSFTSELLPNSYVSWCDNGWIATSGTHTLRWDLDYNDEVPETNEANNSVSRGFAVNKTGAFGDLASSLLNLNGDNLGDVLTYNPASGAWSREMTEPADVFSSIAGSWPAGSTVTSADFNDDVLTDAFLFNTTTGDWSKMLNDGAGFTVQAGGTWWPGWQRFVLDLDGDGVSDLFLYDPATGTWFKCLATPTGFNYSQGGWDPGWEITPTSLNGDARGDLFLINRTTGRWFWVLSQSGSGFTYPVTDTWFPSWNLYPGDFNGDGLGDMLLHHSDTGSYFVAMNNGSGFTYTQGGWSLGWTPYVADLNGDGPQDLFLHNPATGVWLELISDGAGGFTNAGGQTWSTGWNIYVTDFNADGRADLLVYNPDNGIWSQCLNLTLGTFEYVAGSPWPTHLSIVIRSPFK